jgi:hypothetical protein
MKVFFLVVAFLLTNFAEAKEVNGILKGFQLGDSGAYIEVVDAKGKPIELGDASGALPWDVSMGEMPKKYMNQPVTIQTDASGKVQSLTILGITTVRQSRPDQLSNMPGNNPKIGRIRSFKINEGTYLLELVADSKKLYMGYTQDSKIFPWDLSRPFPKENLNAKVSVTVNKDNEIKKVELLK